MSVDHYQSTLAFLKTCPAMAGVFSFQGIESSGSAIQVLTQAGEQTAVKTFIDGSKEKNFDFVVCFYRPISSMPYIPSVGTGNASLESLIDVQDLIDWLDEKSEKREFPDFGTNRSVSRIYSLNTEPQLLWIDSEHYNPPLAKYTVTLRVEYMDYSHSI